MTELETTIGSLFAAAAVAAGGVLTDSATDPRPPAPRTALVIDAAAGRDGRELLDARLRHVDAEVRLPRTSAEARTNVRYFAALGYRVVVTGPLAGAAASATGTPAVRSADLAAAVAAAGH
jgi:hypothetical protein